MPASPCCEECGKAEVEVSNEVTYKINQCNICGKWTHSDVCGGPIEPDIVCQHCKAAPPSDDSDGSTIGESDEVTSDESDEDSDMDDFIADSDESDENDSSSEDDEEFDELKKCVKRMKKEIRKLKSQVKKIKERVGHGKRGKKASTKKEHKKKK